MTSNNPRVADMGSMEVSAEGIKSKIVQSTTTGLKKPHEPSTGIDEETRQQLHRIETKLDAIFAYLKNTPR
jgi:hypothetical protein